MVASIANQIKAALKPCLCLDYDGTLVPFVLNPEEAVPSLSLKALLAELVNDRKLNVAIISGRPKCTLEKWFDEVPVTLVAEHGALIKEYGRPWAVQIQNSIEWKDHILQLLSKTEIEYPGSFVEEKDYCVAWHYRGLDLKESLIASKQVVKKIKPYTRKMGLQIISGDKVVEVRSKQTNKGEAVKKLLNRDHYDLLVAVGDDVTDEDMFTATKEKSITIKVGDGITMAKYRLKSSIDVIELLKTLLK